MKVEKLAKDGQMVQNCYPLSPGMAEIWGAGAAPLTLLTPIVSRLDLMYICVFLDLSYP